MSRDFQRSRVYAWERANGYFKDRATVSMEECVAYATRVFRAERGRYGLANRQVPIVSKGRGRSRAARDGGQMWLGVPGRRPRVIVHELAHCLTPGDMHGPRFVGVLIGMLCRHLGFDRDILVQSAHDMGVKVNLTAIGAVPVFTWQRRVLDALRKNNGRAENDVELAVYMGVSYRVVRGALLSLVRKGEVVRRGRAILIPVPSCASTP